MTMISAEWILNRLEGLSYPKIGEAYNAVEAAIACDPGLSAKRSLETARVEEFRAISKLLRLGDVNDRAAAVAADVIDELMVRLDLADSALGEAEALRITAEEGVVSYRNLAQHFEAKAARTQAEYDRLDARMDRLTAKYDALITDHGTGDDL